MSHYTTTSQTYLLRTCTLDTVEILSVPDFQKLIRSQPRFLPNMNIPCFQIHTHIHNS